MPYDRLRETYLFSRKLSTQIGVNFLGSDDFLCSSVFSLVLVQNLYGLEKIPNFDFLLVIKKIFNDC